MVSQLWVIIQGGSDGPLPAHENLSVSSPTMSMGSPDPLVDWNRANVNALTKLQPNQVPTVEQFLIVQLVAHVPNIPKTGRAEIEDGAQILTLLQGALVAAVTEPPPVVQPELDDDIVSYRQGLVEGAHWLAAKGDEAMKWFTVRLMPAATGQIDDNRGDLDGLVQGLFTWLMLGIVSSAGDGKEPAMWAWAGIRSALAKWSEILTKGS